MCIRDRHILEHVVALLIHDVVDVSSAAAARRRPVVVDDVVGESQSSSVRPGQWPVVVHFAVLQRRWMKALEPLHD